MIPSSLLEWFVSRTERDAGRTALWLPGGSGFRPVSWSQWGHDVFRSVDALRQVGIEAGDRVALWSENRYEWLVVDLAIQCLQAIGVPLHAQLPPRQAAASIEHSGARLLLASSLAKVQALAAVPAAEHDANRGGRPSFVFEHPESDETQFGQSRRIESWAAVCSAANAEAGRELAQRAIDTASPDQVLKILYTSGTTGQPKGVMLTCGNLLSNAEAVAVGYGQRSGDRKLNILPFSHVFAQTNDVNSTIVEGSELALAGSRDTVFDDCRQVQPTLMNGVPSFYERVWRKLAEMGNEQSPGALRDLLGGRIELCNSGGAPLAESLHERFARQGIPLLQGYGLTETSPVLCLSTPQADRAGCVGRPLAGVDVRIAQDGEILARGPNVMAGYYRDERATSEVLREGWLYTGDLGKLDVDGFLRIIGRKKELLVLTNGRKVSPSDVENVLLADPLLQQVAIFGDNRPYVVALVVPDFQQLARELNLAPSDGSSDLLRELVANDDPRIRDRVGQRIEQRNAELAPWQQVRQFALLAAPWSIESGELTAKASLRRSEIAARHAGRLAQLYEASKSGRA